MQTGEIIIVDVDGPLIESNDLFISEINDRFGSEYRYEEISRFSYPNIVDPGHRKFIGEFWARDDLYDGREPVEGAREAWEALNSIGYPVIISKLTRGHHESKDRWLTDVMGIDPDRIWYGSEKWLWRAPVMIDDACHNLVRAQGVGIAPDRPWNQHWSGARAETWPEIVDMVRFLLQDDHEC